MDRSIENEKKEKFERDRKETKVCGERERERERKRDRERERERARRSELDRVEK